MTREESVAEIFHQLDLLEKNRIFAYRKDDYIRLGSANHIRIDISRGVYIHTKFPQFERIKETYTGKVEDLVFGAYETLQRLNETRLRGEQFIAKRTKKEEKFDALKGRVEEAIAKKEQAQAKKLWLPVKS